LLSLYLLELFKGYNTSFFQELSHTNLENPRFLKESMKLNWNFWRGGEGSSPNNNLWGRFGYFLEQHIRK